MTVDERYQRLEDTVRAYNPTASFDKIRAAYEFCRRRPPGASCARTAHPL